MGWRNVAGACAPVRFSLMLEPGSKAPDFILPDQSEARIRLSAYHGKPVVLFFYPKDGSRGCSRQAVSIRDNYAEFRRLGAAVLGISRDGSASHAEFRSSHDLPYPLLTDADGSVAEQYGVPRPLGLLKGRATFVIDSGGIVRLAYSGLLDLEGHTQRALETVRELAGGQHGGLRERA